MVEFISAVLQGVSVWLVVRRNILAFPTGLAGVLLAVPVLFSGKLYGDMALQLFFGAMQVHGWLAWKQSEKAVDERIAVRRLTPRGWLLTVVGTALGTAALGFFLRENTDSPLPWLDGFTTAASVAAQFLMNLRFLENWPVWLLVDVLYVPMLLSRGLFWMAGLYTVFLGMAVAGWLEWLKKSRLLGAVGAGEA